MDILPYMQEIINWSTYFNTQLEMAVKESGVDHLLNFASTRLQGDEKWSYLEYKYLIQPEF